GLWVLTKPTFGSERRGAVVHTDTLIQSGDAAKTRVFTGRQDLVCIYDDTILTSSAHAPTRDLKPEGAVLVNTSRYSPARVRQLLGLGERVSVFVVPASAIARDLQLGSFFNMVMLGAMHRICSLLNFDDALRFYEKNVPKPKEANLEAIRRGFAETTERESVPPEPQKTDERAEAFFHWRPEDESVEEQMLRTLEVGRGV